jgi:phosphoglycerate dehydrogenase-like enzyme
MKILITCGYTFMEEQLKRLEALGCEVVTWPNEREPVSEYHYDADILFSYRMFEYTDITHFKNLKLIQLTSSGLDHVPLELIRERGILLCSARGIYSIPIAEWVILKVLEIYKKSRHFEAAQARALWKQNRQLYELYGKTVGIAGTGSIGTEIAKRAKAFGCSTVGLNTSGSLRPHFDQCYSTDKLHDFLKQSDVVVLTLPLTQKTSGLIDQKALSAMKEEAVLVNVSRGAVINEWDLLNHLGQGHLLGAALDVFNEEPLPPNHDLWRHPRVIATPHNSFLSVNVRDRAFDLAYDNIRAFINVEPLTNLQDLGSDK